MPTHNWLESRCTPGDAITKTNFDFKAWKRDIFTCVDVGVVLEMMNTMLKMLEMSL